jgi:hypothetical protein
MDARGVLLFLHLLGFALWLGVGFTLALLTVQANRSEDRGVSAFVYRAGLRLLKGPGVVGMILTVGSGFALVSTVPGYGFFQPFPDHWLFQMQLLGVLAALLMVAVQIPNADRLARAAEATAAADEASASFVRFRKRNALVSSAIGVLLIAAILMGATRPG